MGRPAAAPRRRPAALPLLARAMLLQAAVDRDPSASAVAAAPACGARDPACFDDTVFTCSECCDTRHGPGVDDKCWGVGFSHARCCPACPLAHEPACFAGGPKGRNCEACCDTRLGPRGDASCWEEGEVGGDGGGAQLGFEAFPRSFERCCLGRAPICTPSLGVQAHERIGDKPMRPALQASQHGQDRFALSWLGCPRGGFYLDIGAYDGVHMSNTHAMDVDLGWTGLCVDAVLRPERFAMRSCRLVQAPVHSRTGDLLNFQRFRDHHGSAYGGLLSAGEAAAGGGVDPVLGRWEAWAVRTVAVRDILRGAEAEGTKVPRVIDYVSVDVERTVPAVLAGFPFERYCVRVWTLELRELNEPGGFEELLQVSELLQHHGYILVEALKIDRVFVHRRDCATDAAEGAL